MQHMIHPHAKYHEPTNEFNFYFE